jgi:hypothetical protein
MEFAVIVSFVAGEKQCSYVCKLDSFGHINLYEFCFQHFDRLNVNSSFIDPIFIFYKFLKAVANPVLKAGSVHQ